MHEDDSETALERFRDGELMQGNDQLPEEIIAQCRVSLPEPMHTLLKNPALSNALVSSEVSTGSSVGGALHSPGQLGHLETAQSRCMQLSVYCTFSFRASERFYRTHSET